VTDAERRLAAIMFSDMVGYSALSQRDEALALRLLQDHQRLLRPIFARHGGHEVKVTGDGFLVDDNRSWSIDNRRLNFQFGTEVAYQVRRGRKGRLLRNFSYGGGPPQFWNSGEAVAGPDAFPVFG